MAEQTPRILYMNRLLDSGVVITASSQDLPVRGVFCLLDPTPTRRWRSKLGWNFLTLFNYKIYFLEGAAARVGTIVVGNYASGTAAAAAIQTAMNTAPGVANTYAVTYSAITKFFTIARTAGASTVTLQFGQSNNDSCHQDMGFDDFDIGPFTTAPQTANGQAFKSREWIKLDHASTFDLRTAVIYGTNFGAAVSNLSKVYYQTGTIDSFANFTLAAGDELGGDDKARIFIGDRTLDTKRWGRFLIQDVRTNTAGYSEVGIAFVGDYLEPSRGVRQGWRQRQGQLTNYAVGDTGSVFVDLKPSPRAWEIEMARVSRSDRDALVAFANTVVLGGSFLYRFDPLNFSGTVTHYVYLTQELGFTQRVGDGTPPERFDVAGFSMTEHL